MKKRIVRITAAQCAAALLAGCGSSISSKDGGYYATEAAAQESYANYDSVAGGVDSGLVPENAAEAATDETAQKIIYNASLSMESTDFDTTREALMAAVEANGAWLESTSLYGMYMPFNELFFLSSPKPLGRNFFFFFISSNFCCANSFDILKGIIPSGLNSPVNLLFITTGLSQK